MSTEPDILCPHGDCDFGTDSVQEFDEHLFWVHYRHRWQDDPDDPDDVNDPDDPDNYLANFDITKLSFYSTFDRRRHTWRRTVIAAVREEYL